MYRCGFNIPKSSKAAPVGGGTASGAHTFKRWSAKRANAKRANAKRANAKRANAKRANAKRANAKRANAKRANAKRVYAMRRSRSENTPAAVTSGPAPGPWTISGFCRYRSVWKRTMLSVWLMRANA